MEWQFLGASIAILGMALACSAFVRQRQLIARLKRNLAQEVERREQAHAALSRTQESVEELVQARTGMLEAANRRLEERSELLERYQRVTRDRELDMLELKATINTLSQRLGEGMPFRVPQNPAARAVMLRRRSL